MTELEKKAEEYAEKEKSLPYVHGYNVFDGDDLVEAYIAGYKQAQIELKDEKISVSRKKLLKIIKDWIDCDFCRSVNIEENCNLKCVENKLKFLEVVE